MIDKRKVDIYRKYKGFYDGYVHDNRNASEPLIESEVWWKIDELVTEYKLIIDGLASESFKNSFEEKLRNVTSDSVVINLIKDIPV
ncbi:hypothetical protein M3P19_15585 [Muricauda sp. 2012CJ35-5]|uniref:Uncharacterized protein n=1 Tax=Flagellimonas spongiicola TaxID=2942208 RepID=A0ABT0PW72_9FLAO|nr:hypothetical protein [Allomuricauda spongiicola]MCL6275436.1 hypothetical protein [Allomuricauda spongiicola]